MKKSTASLPTNATRAHDQFYRRFWICSTLISILVMPAAAQLELLKDINTAEELTLNEYTSFTVAGHYMYFVSNQELWKTNGSTKYTVRMKSFTSISNLTMSGSTLFFTADDGISGPELWKSNGSPASTVSVKDIIPGAEGSSPAYLTDVNGTLFFAANSEGKGTELWRTDGTTAGTFLVKDIRVGRQGSNAAWLTNVGGTLYFAANDGKKGHELWKSNGTTAGTRIVKDLRPGAYLGSAPRQLTNVNGTLFFEALDGAGRELWKSNGTSETTIRLKDIHRGPAYAGIENMIAVNNILFFSATDGTHGQELWMSDGTETGTMLVKDVNPGSTGSIPRDRHKQSVAQFTNINGVLYFITTTGNRYFIHRSDGTSNGTLAISDLRGWSEGVPQPAFTYRNGYVYFFNFENISSRYYLAKMPYLGSAGSLVASFEASYEYEEKETEFKLEMVRLNNAVYFGGRPYMNEENYGGYELIRSDGTEEGTFPIHDTFVPTRGSFPREMISVNGLVYFHLYPWLSYSPELYRTDGTPEGTFQLRPSRFYYEWEAVGNDLYFVETARYPWELYKTSGTLESTRLVAYSQENYGEDSMPKGLTDVNGTLYYFNDLGELWKSDGTAASTVRIADLYSIKIITDVNGVAYVLAENENDGLELWKKVSSGLVLVKTIANARASLPYYHEGALSIGGVLYFLTQEDADDYQIWRSDGTATGTYRMFGRDGFQGNSELRLIRYNEKLFFSDGTAFYSTDGNTYAKVADLPSLMRFTETNGKLILFTVAENGLLVYASDGSPEGTELVHTKALEMYHLSTVTIGRYVYYNTIYTPYTYFGADLWRTDGTICGTSRVDVGTGNPYALGVAGDDLVFGASLPATGNEPYVYHNINSIPTSVCQEPTTPLATGTFQNPTPEDIMTSYPNPFTDSFTMKVNGNDGDMAEVVIHTATGMPVEKNEEVPANVEQNYGSTWQKGFYIVKVRIGHKSETYHLIKK